MYVNCRHCKNDRCERYNKNYGYTFCDKYVADAGSDTHRDGLCAAQEYKPGDPVWVVERDEIDEPDCVSGYVFVAHANGVAIVHPYIGECGEIDEILYDCITETRENGECDLEAFPFEDCYHSLEEAERALEGGTA